MKNLKFIPVIAMFAIFISCGKDNENGQNKVDFPEQPEKTLSLKPTGRTSTKGTEYVETFQKQLELDPPQLINNDLINSIYPGSVLDGGDFMNAVYTNLVIKDPKEITLSTTLKGKDYIVSDKALPVLSDVRQTINGLVYTNRGQIDFNNTSSLVDYTAEEVNTKESFNKIFSVHVKANFLKVVNAGFNYSQEHLTIHSKKYVLVKLRQIFYTVSVDPKSADEWGNIQSVGAYEPVYVSSVDYGRVAHLLLETEDDKETVRKTISGSIGANIGKFGVEISAENKQEIEKLFNKTNMKIMIWGGDLANAKLVTDYNSFMEFLKRPAPEDLVKSCTPVGYRVKTIRDNRPIAVRTMYTEERFTYKK
mgnify:CR=1 FL=1